VRDSFGPNQDAIPADFVARRQVIWMRPTVIAALSEERVEFARTLAAQAPHYGEIRKPVVIVCGEQDKNHGDSLRLEREVPGARLVTLPNTGHYVQFARPNILATIIEEAAK
jgi:pimeloyl-ACP methyl ester carboxylesterase